MNGELNEDFEELEVDEDGEDVGSLTPQSTAGGGISSTLLAAAAATVDSSPIGSPGANSVTGSTIGNGNGANSGDNQSIQSIASQAAAAMAAAMAAQQLLASAAAIFGLDLATFSNFAVMAGHQQQQLQQLQQQQQNGTNNNNNNNQTTSNNIINATNSIINGHLSNQQQQQVAQIPAEQLMATALAVAPFLAPNHLVPEDLTVSPNNTITNNININQTSATANGTVAALSATGKSNGINGHQQLTNQQQQQQYHQPHHHLRHHSHLNHSQQQQLQHLNNNNNNNSNNNNSTNNLSQHQQHQQIHQQQHQHQHQQQQQHHHQSHHHQHHRHHHLLGGHHHHSSIQTQQQLLATKGFNPLAMVGAGGQTEILTPTHLKKAKLMFFYVRYPNSSTLKECFRDVRFNKNNTAQLVKWFSNFREFYYIQMEKFARDAVADDRIQCKEDIVVNHDHELINQLNNHYNKNRHIELPEVFRQVVQETLRHFFDSIHERRDQEQSWKKAIYKLIARLDQEVPEVFKTDAFNEHLE